MDLFKDLILIFRLCPVFQVSNVSGENLPLLKMFLNLLSTRSSGQDKDPAEFQVCLNMKNMYMHTNAYEQSEFFK